MADFKTHLIGGVATSSFATGYFYNSGLGEPLEIIPFVTLGVIGTFLPDIDSDNSTSLRLVFKVLSIILPAIIVTKLFNYLSLIQIIFVALVTILSIRIFLWGLKALTVHRGIIHSVPAGGMFSLMTICILKQIPFISEDIPFCAGIILFVGYITHLVLDELYAINLAGLELTRSFGTALKFIAIGDLVPSLLMYLSIFILYLQAIGVGWRSRIDKLIETFII